MITGSRFNTSCGRGTPRVPGDIPETTLLRLVSGLPVLLATVDLIPTFIYLIRPETLEIGDGCASLAVVEDLPESRHDSAKRYPTGGDRFFEN